MNPYKVALAIIIGIAMGFWLFAMMSCRVLTTPMRILVNDSTSVAGDSIFIVGGNTAHFRQRGKYKEATPMPTISPAKTPVRF